MTKNKVVGAIIFALGLLTTLSPRFILPVCEFAGKSPMDCGFMGRAEMFTGAIVISIGVGAFFSRGVEALRWLMLVSLVTGVVVIATPHVLGYCPSAQMPCNYGAVPMLRFLGILLIITSAVGLIISRAGRSETGQTSS
ncbi:MAG: DUF4418 family protein [Nitrospirota bacterium]